jgi:hypothetical protein
MQIYASLCVEIHIEANVKCLLSKLMIG